MFPTAHLKTRNAAATRAALLKAARNRFADRGYDATSLRDVAADAGVDAALVVRYFGSKDDLFAAALDACDDTSWLEGDPQEISERLAGILIEEEPCSEDVEGLMILLRSCGSPKAQEVISRWSDQSFLRPLSNVLDGEDADLRARMTGSVMLGVMLSRALFNREWDEGDQQKFQKRLTAVFQACVEA